MWQARHPGTRRGDALWRCCPTQARAPARCDSGRRSGQVERVCLGLHPCVTGLAGRWKAYTTGNFAQFYRFDPPDDADQVAQLLTNLKSPGGMPVFERVIRKSAASHPDSGDIAAYAWPRFGLTPGSSELFAAPLAPGQHGARNTHRELHTTLGARGAGIEAERIEELPQTEIAPFVRRLLGLR